MCQFSDDHVSHGLCFVYEYDDVGNIESVTQCTQLTGDHEPVAPYSTTQYVYDRIGQLIRVNDPQDLTAGNSGTTWVYTYNLGGNILSKNAYAYTTGDIGTAVESHSFTYGNDDWRDQLTAYDGHAITYDDIGNPLDDGTWQYEWQHGRQLKKMTKPGETIEFKYNADGLRVEKIATSTGTTKYTLHGKNIVHLTNGSNELHFWYDAQNRPAIVDFNGVKYAYVYNLQGDVVALVGANGNPAVCYVYDAWGKPVSKTGTTAATLGTLNPFRYRGYVFDEETGLYYLRSRYYSHERSRFLIPDSVYVSNLYCYCDNDCINELDSDGMITNKEMNYLKRIFNPLLNDYPSLTSSKIGNHSMNMKMSGDQFAVHLWHAYSDKKWKYVYGSAQYRSTDCVGLYKMIMEWYYDSDAFNEITIITQGRNTGKKFNQVKDLIRFGIEGGEDGLSAICLCCQEPPIGAAVFAYEDNPLKNKKLAKNNGWVHVGYYIGYGYVIQAHSSRVGITVSSITDSKWDCYGLLKGVKY